jgi:hypothetical protein
MTAWTSDQIETFKELAVSGASRARIAARLGRTQSAIKLEAKKLGVKIKSPKEVRKANGLSPYWGDNR